MQTVECDEIGSDADKTDQAAGDPEPRPTGKPGGSPGARLRAGAVVAVLVAVGVVVWAIVAGVGGGDGGSASPTPTGSGTSPVALSASGLGTLTAVLPDAVYWVGPRRTSKYEFSRTVDGKTYVRYLPEGVKAGDAQPLLTVGTYPMVDAFSSMQSMSRQGGSVAIEVPGGAVAFSPGGSETNAYVAFPDTDFQVEVYDPTPGRARRLVEQGAVEPVPPKAVEGP